MSLVVASCSYESAKWAVEHWHYSQTIPVGKLVCYGVWESDQFRGSIVFGRGANKDLSRPYALDQVECCELVRIALRSHESYVSEMVASALRLLKAQNPGLRLVVSFADTEQGHHGGVYQAGNWVYLGKTEIADEYIVRGRRIHGRSARAKRKSAGQNGSTHPNVLAWLHDYVDPNARQIWGSSKHRYVFPLDRRIRKQIAPLALPYPSADEDSKESRPTSGGESRVRFPASAPQS